MAMQPYTGASSSSSSSMVVSLKKYHVFISFRGEDTRTKFTSHLYTSLSKYFRTFIDENELQKGDEISSALIKAIEEANASVVVFSENYASSRWCLDELVKILECKKNHEQIVIPVFYEVDPSHVRNHSGSYGLAFEKHELDLKHSKDKLQKWRNALTQAANLSGWDSQKFRNESNFIKNIVADVLEKLYRRHPIEVNEELVGIEEKNNAVESWMKIGSNKVKTLVVWGMGGIGKTTLAKYAYAKQSPQFDRHCFFETPILKREECNNCVRQLYLSKLFELPLNAPYLETPILKRSLACEKSLIVLDNVATLEQAENLNNMCLGPGSRIIVTTRDKQICSQFDECTIYEVKGLNKYASLQLFCWHAFRTKHAKVGYEELIERAIGYCGGNPLALKVLGTNFRTKSKEVWESELEKLKKIPNKSIHDLLRLSFDDLDDTQKDIFLDIACFFNRRLYTDRDYLTILFNACNFFAVSGIDTLLCKALIEIITWWSGGNEIEMHDLLVEMGREIVKQESPKHPDRRSRLWDYEDVYDVLKNNKGTGVVEVIFFEFSKVGDVYLRADSFQRMINLRYLHITSYTRKPVGQNGYEYVYQGSVHLPYGLKWSSDIKLRYLHWDFFPLESLPSTFCVERLVVLSMPESKLRKLWDGIQNLENLVQINLTGSKDLIKIPDLSRAPNLKEVDLSYCVSLCQVDSSIFTAPKLESLNLKHCKKLESLKSDIHSKSLCTLDPTECSSLVEFSVTSEKMERLCLSGTAIHEFPSSMWLNRKLGYLNLSDCTKLDIVGKNLSNDSGLRSLTALHLSRCTQINASNLSFILDGMPSLFILCLRGCCSLETLPDNIQNNSRLNVLNLDECWNLESLPNLPVSLEQLTAVNCTYLNTNSIFEHMLQRLSNTYEQELCYYKEYYYIPAQVSIFPGAQVPSGFKYQTTEASIVIPPIPKSGLSCFIFCIILSKGLSITDVECGISCFIYENKKVVWNFDKGVGTSGTLNSDHVLLLSLSSEDFQGLEESESGGDHYNLSFEFKHCFDMDDDEDDNMDDIDEDDNMDDDEDDNIDDIDEEHNMDDDEGYKHKWIKGCGVYPVYGLKQYLGWNESDEDEFDIDESDELQHQAIGAEAGGSTNENEDDDQQQLLMPPTKRRRI